MEEIQHTGWVLIPPEIYSRNDISSTEKILLGRVIALSNKTGFCFAHNDFFVKDLGLTEIAVQKMFEHLEKIELIKREFEKNQRKIYYNGFIMIINREGIKKYRGGYKNLYPLKTRNDKDFVINSTFPNDKKDQSIRYSNRVFNKLNTARADISFLIDLLKEKANLKTLDGSINHNRRYAKLLIDKFGYDKTQQMIIVATKDSFWASKITDLKTIYNNGNKLLKLLEAETPKNVPYKTDLSKYQEITDEQRSKNLEKLKELKVKLGKSFS